jgi:hypothetical protein
MGASIINSGKGGAYVLVGKPGSFGVNELTWQQIEFRGLVKRDLNGFAEKQTGCLTVFGENIRISDCDPRSDSQLWNMRGTMIRSASTGMCINVQEVTVGTKLEMTECNSTSAGMWLFHEGKIRSMLQSNTRVQQNVCIGTSGSLITGLFNDFDSADSWREENDIDVELIGNGRFIGKTSFEQGTIAAEGRSFDGDSFCSKGSITCGSRTIKSTEDGPSGSRSFVLEFRKPEIPFRTAQYSVWNKKAINYAGIFSISAMVKCGKHFDGVEQLLFTKFYYESGA